MLAYNRDEFFFFKFIYLLKFTRFLLQLVFFFSFSAYWGPFKFNHWTYINILSLFVSLFPFLVGPRNYHHNMWQQQKKVLFLGQKDCHEVTSKFFFCRLWTQQQMNVHFNIFNFIYKKETNIFFWLYLLLLKYILFIIIILQFNFLSFFFTNNKSLKQYFFFYSQFLSISISYSLLHQNNNKKSALTQRITSFFVLF